MLKKATQNLIINRQVIFYNSSRCLTKATTVDNCEIEHFKILASEWWDEMGIMKSLHAMNFLRVPFVRDSLVNTGIAKKEFVDTPEPLKELQILDIGCGGGFLSEPLARLGCKVIGIDASNDLITVAKDHASKDKTLSNLTYLTSSVEEFSKNNPEVFDAVVSSEVIEHVNDKTSFIRECVKCLKPGGSIIFTTVNKTFLSGFLMLCVAERFLGVVRKGTHEYEKFIEPHSVQRLLEDNNCCTKVIHGMFYNPFTNSWSWISDTSVSYAIHAVKIVP